MKTKTSKLILACSTLILFLIISSSFKTNASGNKYLTVLVINSISAPRMPDAKIIIVYEDEKTEEIALENTKESTYLPNTVKINRTLNSLAEKGYELIAASDTKYTFAKK